MEAAECCILGICCAEQKRIQALADKIQADLLAKGLHLNDTLALAVATDVREVYDLAPKGMIQPLIDLVAAEAREYPDYQQD